MRVILQLLLTVIIPLSVMEVMAIDHYYSRGRAAIHSYDPVAYFDGKPKKGSEEYVYHREEVDWYFSSKLNLEKFKTDPEKYALQYGGYCAWAVSKGYTASADPRLDGLKEKTLSQLQYLDSSILVARHHRQHQKE